MILNVKFQLKMQLSLPQSCPSCVQGVLWTVKQAQRIKSELYGGQRSVIRVNKLT